MKYRKNEAKEYAREKLKGVWTALPTVFTDGDEVDAEGNRFNIERCIGFEVCGLCKNQCPEEAISKRDGGKANIDRSRCNHCGNCATVCPNGALALVGREMSIAEILDVVAADDGFHF